MSLRFYINKTNGVHYLQLWKNKEQCVSLGTPDLLVKTLLDEDKTKILREKITKLTEGK